MGLVIVIAQWQGVAAVVRCEMAVLASKSAVQHERGSGVWPPPNSKENPGYVLLGAYVVLKIFFAAKGPFDVMCQCGLLKYHDPKTKKNKNKNTRKDWSLFFS